ncbi:retrotransposable element, partial [Pimephales promelas]
KFRYPLPLVLAALEQLRASHLFSKLDLRSTYNLIRIRKGDEWKTAFITPAGHYEYLVMPFGLSISPAVFRGFMNEIFRDYLNQFDILIYSANLSEHIRHVRTSASSIRQPFSSWAMSSPPQGITIDQRKVDAVTNWPRPTNLKELQRFLGFANFYRRFIKDAINAFEDLKKTFSSAPTLILPDPDLPFLVEVDASTSGVGAVLSQRQGNPLRLHPCAFFSKKLSPAEQNYNIGNRELLAIKLALEEWRHWLKGAQHPFIVITDHHNLEYLCEARRLNPRQARWALFFTRFNFTYRPGHKNIKADALSRQFQPDSSPSVSETILPPAIVVSPIQWSLDDHIAEATQAEPAPPGAPKGTGVDFVTDLPVSDSHTCILVVVDRFSKACKLIPLPVLPTAFETAETLFHQIFRHFGIPEDIVSDRGPQFISRVWKAFFNLLGVTVSLNSGYHLESNGQTERKIQEIGRYLRSYCHDHQDCWSHYLPWAEYAQNSLRQSTTGQYAAKPIPDVPQHPNINQGNWYASRLGTSIWPWRGGTVTDTPTPASAPDTFTPPTRSASPDF